MNRAAAVVLVIANLAVAVSVLLHRLGYYQLILVYWCETIIIALYNVGRLFAVFLLGEPFGKWMDAGNWLTRLFFAAVLSCLFLVKFGIFALALGFLVAMVPAFLTGPGEEGGLKVWQALRTAGPVVWTCVCGLFVSHGVSFLLNFLLRREYKKAKILFLLFWPYARMSLMIFVTGLGLLLARMTPMRARSTAFALTVVLAKLAADLVTHRFEHTRVLGQASTTG